MEKFVLKAERLEVPKTTQATYSFPMVGYGYLPLWSIVPTAKLEKYNIS
jgi:hypothetical protein